MPGLKRRSKFLRLQEQMTTAPEYRVWPQRQKDRLGLIRGTALVAIDAGIRRGSVEWRRALEEIADLAK